MNGERFLMSTFAEKVAAAKAASKPKDVFVTLDGELSAEREKIIAEVEAAKKNPDERLAAKSPVDLLTEKLEALNDVAAESLVLLRFWRIPGRAWNELTSRHPVRIDVPVDKRYGYNFDAVSEAAARFQDESGRPFGVRVEDGVEIPMAPSEWDDLLDSLSGHDFGAIVNAVWELNEWEPQQRVGELVKAFGAAARSVKN